MSIKLLSNILQIIRFERQKYRNKLESERQSSELWNISLQAIYIPNS